jgi:hypothetical protein
MRTTQQRMIPADEQAQTGRFAAQAEPGVDPTAMNQEDMDRAISSSDIEDETTIPPSSGGAVSTGRPETPSLAAETSSQAEARWQQIQSAFVDDPRKAVGEAHQLVGEIMQRIADAFAQERDSLEQRWSRGNDVSTEDLRVCLQNYRDFFARLLPSARVTDGENRGTGPSPGDRPV